MAKFNANIDVFGRITGRRFPYQENVLDIQIDNTLDPGASPAEGARYLIENSASLHANFGSITGLADDDIVEYRGNAFIVIWDASVNGEGALVYDEDSNGWYEYTGSAWTAFASADELVKVTSNDTTGGYLNDKLTSSDSSITFTEVNDGGDEDLSLTVNEANVDHDSLQNFVANEHVDHTSVNITAGSGLNGGGDISASRTINLDVNSLTAAGVAAADELAFADADDASNMKKITFSNLEGTLNHDSLSGFVANEHVDHSGVEIQTGVDSGLSGGGDITTTRSLSVDIDGTTAITTIADADTMLVDDGDGGTNRKITRSNFIGSAAITMGSNIDINLAGGGEVLGLPASPSATGAASKEYVDSLVAAGISWKDAVRVATAAAGTLASDFENGDSVDGVTLATGDRILIKDQAAAAENGIYSVNATGAPTRVADMDAAGEFDGAAVFVQEGTANADKGFVQTNTIATVDTDAVSFTQFTGLGQITAGAGLTKSGDTLDVGAGDGITVNADDVAVDPATEVAGSRAAVYVGADGVGIDLDNSTLTHTSSTLQVADAGIDTTQLADDAVDSAKLDYASTTLRVHSEAWTNAQGTSKVVTHNFATNLVAVTIYDNDGETIWVDTVDRTSTNAVTLTAISAPPSGEDYTVIVQEAPARS